MPAMGKKCIATLSLRNKAFLLFPLGIVMTGLMLFLPAGSLRYWQGAVFMASLFIPAAFVAAYFLKHDPQFLERRMKFKEKQMEQKAIVKAASVLFVAGFLFPGFDFRYGWSHVPAWLVIASDILMVLCYLAIFRVFQENSYASRTVGVEKGQKVVTTGPYSFVRHPMYAAVIVMYLCVPLALGSYWALAFFIPIIPLLVARTLNEEKVLLRGLKGYRSYTEKVKYRLLPGVW